MITIVVYDPDSDQNTIPDSPIIAQGTTTIIQSSIAVEFNGQNAIQTRKVIF